MVRFKTKTEAESYIERTKDFAGIRSIYKPLEIKAGVWTIKRVGKKK